MTLPVILPQMSQIQALISRVRGDQDWTSIGNRYRLAHSEDLLPGKSYKFQLSQSKEHLH